MFSWLKRNSPSSDSPHSWYLILNDYLVVQVCLAFEQIGFWDAIKSGPATIEELAKKIKAREDLLRTGVEFLWSVTDFLEKKGSYFMIKDYSFPATIWTTMAYKPAFDLLGELITGNKRYGRDLVRDGYYLQKASDLFSADALRRTLQLLNDETSAVLVDFGCGSGKALISYCEGRPERRGIGIDNDSKVVKEARKHIREKNLEKRIEIVEKDVIDIGSWNKLIPKSQKIIFLASTILHEFLINGESSLVKFLRKLKMFFPNSRLCIIEFNGLPFEEIKRKLDFESRLFAARYALWHPLTNQGMPQSQTTWERIIQKAGWHLKSLNCASYNLVIYECLRYDGY